MPSRHEVVTMSFSCPLGLVSQMLVLVSSRRSVKEKGEEEVHIKPEEINAAPRQKSRE